MTLRDGTIIGLRRFGERPRVVLLHGVGQTSRNLLTMVRELDASFTLNISDRRGRRMIGPFGDGHGIDKEIEDFDALLRETGALDRRRDRRRDGAHVSRTS